MHRFVVALRTHGTHASAVGALIAPRWVVTAAHCASEAVAVIGAERLAVPAPPGTAWRVARAWRHAGASPRRLRHDIALLELSDPVPWRPVRLATAEEMPAPGRRLRLLGWRLQSGVPGLELRQRRPRVLSRQAPGLEGVELPGEMLAAEPGLWPGDSGSPLVADAADGPVLISVAARTGYGRSPDLHTAVAPYRDWIAAVLRGETSQAEPCFLSPPAS